MTARLVLHLSGAWTDGQDGLLEDGDILYRMPHLSAVSQRDGWQELPQSQGDIGVLRDQYLGLFAGLEDRLASLPFASLINDQFIYSVIPVASALTEIAGIIESRRPSQILLFHAPARGPHIPATGIVTLESSRGSRDVLGSLIAASVKAGVSKLPVVSHKLRGDALSHGWTRRAALRVASSLILLRFVFRMLRSDLGRETAKDRDGIRGLALVRSVEHARHAARVFSGIEDVGALVTPQFTQGSSAEIETRLQGHLPLFVPKASSLLRSLFRGLAPTPRTGLSKTQQITCGPFAFTACLTELERDFNAVRFYAFQNALLRDALRTFPSARFTAGFEVQGAFAWTEGCIPRSAGLTTRTIQPVLVQNRPLPVFPFSDCFLADSAPNRADLADIGGVRLGAVDFQGPPFEVREVRTPRPSMALGYFTQPYETQNNVAIAQTLCRVAKSRGWTVILRLHPREDAAQFDPVLERYSGICTIAKAELLEQFVDTVDVSITRTSSVTKEAIARGCACVTVLLSDLDQRVQADYIRADGQTLPHVVTDLDAMASRICDPVRLKETSVQLQDRLFNGRGFPEFVEFVSR
ncbi:hypothetical protein [Sulfitobacter sp. 1A15142]|uniref:hypothetical protein n=1 Tax=Sulfitobacter sp. 1A15142 TaxID=3368587 RepID=UPI003746D829